MRKLLSPLHWLRRQRFADRTQRSLHESANRRAFLEQLENRNMLNAAPIAQQDDYYMHPAISSVVTLSVAAPGILANDTDAAMFLLCDQPKISPELINGLIDLYERALPLICAPAVGQIRGNPVIFSKRLFPELMQIEGDTGGRTLIKKHWDQASKLDLASADVFMDIDTIGDLPLS